MTEDKTTISQLVDSQFPEFVRDNHPRFLEFIRSYYEWLESTGQVLNHSANIFKNQDIDYSTEDKYLDRLFREFLVNIPISIVTDKANLLKNIRQFYRARGTEKSFELFFRFLYNLNPEFYYPRVDILKVSDGKWIKQKSLRVFAVDGSPNTFISNRIRGRESNTTAFVERSLLIQKNNFIGYELILNTSSITGKFIPGETVELDVPNTNVTARISAVPQSVSLSKDLLGNDISGAGYSVGQKFKIEDLQNFTVYGQGLEIEITSVSNTGQIQNFKILDYGLGYEKGIPIINYPLLSQAATQTALIDIDLGAVISYDGYYYNQDGQLSALKYIHDGHFYQQFSYVVYVNETLQTYEDAVKQLIHPAGFKLFGGFRTQELFNSTVKSADRLLTRQINYKKLNIDSISAAPNVSSSRPNVNLGTTLTYLYETRKDSGSYSLGSTKHSVYRNRYAYKPVSKYNANNEISQIPNYFGIFGDLSAQYAITPISAFEQAGLTPFNIETMLHQVTNILPDAVIKKETI